MTPQPAFAFGVPSSSFTSNRLRSTINNTPLRPIVTPSPSTIRMQEKKPGFFRNPFQREPGTPETTYADPQPGDPGSKAPAPVPKSTGMSSKESKPGKQLPVVEGAANIAKRGLALLKEDLLKSAPEKAGVGRQDRSFTMKPLAGEPGYKPAAYQTVKVSQLGISPFVDDDNAVGKVGGVEAVIKAAQDAKKGATAKEIKRKILLKEAKLKEKEPEVFDIPDYLKSLPEDTPRRGMSWKNYVGR